MFSKSERFKESVSTGPPVGTYDIGGSNTSLSGTSFQKAARFKTEGTDGDVSFSEDSLLVAATPRRTRKLSSNSSSDGRITPGSRPPKDAKKRSVSPSPKVAELEKELKKLYSERGDLSKQLRLSKEEVAKLEGKLQVAVRDKSTLQAEVASLQKTNMNLARGKNILEAKSSHSVDAGKARTLQNQLDQKSRQLEANSQEFQRMNSQMEESKRSLEGELKQEKENRAELEVRLAVVEDELFEAKEGKEKLSVELTNLQAAHEMLESEHSKIKAELVEAQELCQSQSAELTSTKEQLSSALEQKKSLEDQLSTSSQERFHLKEELEKAQQSVTETSQENSKLRVQLQSLEEKVKELTAENDRLESELTNTQVDLRATKTELAKHQEESQQALESLTKKCLAFEEELSHHKKVSKETQAVLKSQIVAMEVASNEQSKEYQATLKILETKKSKNADLEEQVKWLKHESEEAKVASEANIKEVLTIAEDLRTKKAEQEATISELTRANEKLEKDYTETAAQLKETSERATSLDSELENLKPSAEKAADERANLMKQEMGKQLVDTQKRLSAQEQQYDLLRSELLERIAELEAEVGRLRDENEQVTAAYEELEERYRPFLEQVDSLEDLNKLLQSQTSLAQSEAEKFGELYAKVLGHQNHKQKIQYVKKLREENMSLKQEITVMRSEITKLKKSLRKQELGGTAAAAPGKKPLVNKN